MLQTHVKTNWSYKAVFSIYGQTLFTQLFKIRKRAKNRYNQAPHLTQDTDGKVTTSQFGITNESEEVSPFPVGDHKALIIRRA